MASKIDEKYADLRAKGLDLGPATGPEQSAGYGGTFRTFKNGNIYWHPVMGATAHEVHGGILSLYLANGGPGVNPKTGIREFGFPLSDEVRTPADQTPFCDFETGAIYWTPGTGGVVMYGDIYKGYRQHVNSLGLPVSSLATIYTGSGIYCERGILWTAPALKGAVLFGSFQPPLMGKPMIAAAGTAQVSLGNLISWSTPGNDLTHNLSLVDPAVLSNVWKNRLVLAPVGGGPEVPLWPGDPNLNSMTSLDTAVSISLTATAPLLDSKLYDIHLRPPTGNVYNLSPHCVYSKKSWDNFGLLHATDIHLSLRNQNLRAALTKAGMTEAAQKYANCQECFRDFIHYANHLHALGLADAVMATGDLIDYVKEPGDNPYSGNFERLRRMILGQPFDTGVPAGEELQIPIFLTFGNHDYRLNKFELSFFIDVDLKVWEKTIPMDEYTTFNLTPDEATAAQGGRITYGLSDFAQALKMLEYDATGGAYAYFSKYFSDRRTFMVTLGANRLVLLDNSYDAGVPQIDGWESLVKFLYEYETNGLSQAADRAVNGTIDAAGLYDDVYRATQPALDEAGPNGVVIVGMHVPPFSPVNSEFPYYLRETVHPVADPKLTQDYLSRNGIKADGWTLSGTPYFKTGEIGNGHGLDNGVISQHGMDFIRLLAGVELGVKRPVDLFLCGHHHQRMEYRMRWNGSDIQFFMDFYLEEPTTYYGTTTGFDIKIGADTIPKGSRLAIHIDPTAPATGRIAAARVHQGSISEVRGSISLPPYASPLDSAADPKKWWEDHRPIVAQTAALGPIDPVQRFDPQWEITYAFPGTLIPPKTVSIESKTQPAPKALPGETITVKQVMTQYPDPTFNGFRFVQVQGNVIHKVRYINLAELRASNFKLPWENPSRADVSSAATSTSVLETRT